MNFTYNPAKGLVLAMIPVYLEEGTAYKIFYEDGSFEVSTNRLNYIMNQYLSTWHLKLNSLVSKCKKTDNTGTKPFSVTLNHTFVPLRARESRIVGDKVYGLFWHEKIRYPRKFNREPVGTLLCGGLAFEVCCNYIHLQQKRLEADDAQLDWKRLNGVFDVKNPQLKNLYTGINMMQQAFEKMQNEGMYAGEVEEEEKGNC